MCRIVWKEQMESKRAGDLYRMLLGMEQELRSTCRTLDQKELQQIKDLIASLHQDLSHSEKSTQH